MECLIHSPVFNNVEMAWVAGLAEDRRAAAARDRGVHGAPRGGVPGEHHEQPVSEQLLQLPHHLLSRIPRQESVALNLS